MNCPKCSQELTVMANIVICGTKDCIGTRTLASLEAEKKYANDIAQTRAKMAKADKAIARA